MAYEQSQPLKLSIPAGADLSTHQYKFVKLSGDTVILCAALTDNPIGVLQNKPTSGLPAEIVCIGVTKVVADAALATIGTQIGTSANGRADAKILGTDVTEFVAGRTLSVAGAANELLTALVNCSIPHNAVTAN